jgi:CubicO group peptidase (beta-lactamase class C family)
MIDRGTMVRPRGQHRGALLIVLGATLLSACTGTTASVSRSPNASASVAVGSSASASLATAIESWRGKRDTRRNVRAIIVSVDGRTVFEKYYGTAPEVARDMESVTKSVTATLVGAALARHQIRSVDQTLAELLPAYASTMAPAVAKVTLRQLLTMTAGVPDWSDQTLPAPTTATDWVAATLAAMVPTPEAKFHYSNPDAHLVAAIVTQATGKTLLEFARDVLFAPLGIDTANAIEPLAVPSNFDAYKAAQFAWPVDPQHVNLGYALLTLRPRDMLKVGQLYLNGGIWEGKQLLPADWVADATSAQVKTYSTWDSYGYLWWVTSADQVPAYAATGAGGQLIEVIPSRRMVVVASSDYNAANPATNSEEPFDLTSMVNSVIAPALAP